MTQSKATAASALNTLAQQNTRQRYVLQSIENMLFSAMLGAFGGALWVIQYMLSTTYGSSYDRSFLWNYVTGTAYEDLLEASQIITAIALTRFIIAFGLIWFVSMIVISILRAGWGTLGNQGR